MKSLLSHPRWARAAIERLSPRTEIEVDVRDVYVTLRMGTRAVDLDYDTANRLAVLLRGYARIAKRNAGDTSMRVVGFAHLTDATMEELKAQRRRDTTAAFIKPEKMK